jgi:hypothetical protein
LWLKCWHKYYKQNLNCSCVTYHNSYIKAIPVGGKYLNLDKKVPNDLVNDIVVR